MLSKIWSMGVIVLVASGISLVVAQGLLAVPIAGSLPLVAHHSGLAEIAAGVAGEYPEQYRDLVSFTNGDSADLSFQQRPDPLTDNRVLVNDQATQRGADGHRRAAYSNGGKGTTPPGDTAIDVPCAR